MLMARTSMEKRLDSSAGIPDADDVSEVFMGTVVLVPAPSILFDKYRPARPSQNGASAGRPVWVSETEKVWSAYPKAAMRRWNWTFAVQMPVDAVYTGASHGTLPQNAPVLFVFSSRHDLNKPRRNDRWARFRS